MGHNYNVYLYWETILPAIIGIAAVPLTFILASLVFCCHSKRIYRWTSYHAAKVLLKDNLKEKDNKYVMFKREVSLVDVLFAAIAAPFLLNMAFITFWGVFLVDDS